MNRSVFPELRQLHKRLGHKVWLRSNCRCQAATKALTSTLAQCRFHRDRISSNCYQRIASRAIWESCTKSGSWKWPGWIMKWKAKPINSQRLKRESRTSNRTIFCSKQVAFTSSHWSSDRETRLRRCFWGHILTEVCRALWSRQMSGTETITYSSWVELVTSQIEPNQRGREQESTR